MPVPVPPTQSDAISMSALDLITSAMRLIGVIASGERPKISESNDCLMVLRQLIDTWNADRLTIYTTQALDFPLVGNQQAYTLGPGGDFDTQRPERIEGMSAILLTNPENPIEIPMDMYTVTEWQTQMPVKNVSSSFPQICYDNGDFPLRTLSFWPLPTQVNNVRIYGWQALQAPTSLQSVLSYPSGYARALRFNLAVDLSAEFAAPLQPSVQGIAVDSLARIKSINAPKLDLRSDLISDPAGWNYRADMFGIPF